MGDRPNTDEAGTEVTIQHILADQAAVVLELPGLFETEQVEQLVIDVSRKPVISLVWVGAILIVAGGLLTYRRRWAEARN